MASGPAILRDKYRKMLKKHRSFFEENIPIFYKAGGGAENNKKKKLRKVCAPL
jgi:hypothetical protein